MQLLVFYQPVLITNQLNTALIQFNLKISRQVLDGAAVSPRIIYH